VSGHHFHRCTLLLGIQPCIKAFDMHIACTFPTPAESQAWARDLQRSLGTEATVRAWQMGDSPSDVAVVWKPNQAFFDAQPKLKAIFAAGAGVDALLRLSLPAGVPLVRLEDAGMSAQMVEYVCYGVLRFFRGFDRYEQQARQGQWLAHPPEKRSDWPVGLMGYGALGQPVAAALKHMGFPVRAWARSAKPNAEIEMHVGDEGLSAFLQGTRVLVCMLPLTDATRHIIGASTLSRLMPGACLINVARGGHVQEADLVAALDAGRLQGALLDVCEVEPAAGDHPFWRHPRVQLTPHIAATTLRDEAVAQIAQKIKQLRTTGSLSGVVKGLGY
jgi:glyoxylate/hydroxypyruvate reductase